MAISEKSQLGDPVTEEDIIDQEDYLDSLLQTQHSLANRVAYQAGPQHPVAVELKYIAQLIDYAGNRIAELRKTKVFPSQEQIDQLSSQR